MFEIFHHPPTPGLPLHCDGCHGDKGEKLFLAFHLISVKSRHNSLAIFIFYPQGNSVQQEGKAKRNCYFEAKLKFPPSRGETGKPPRMFYAL